MKIVHGSCCSLYRAIMEFRRNLGSGRSWNKKCLFSGDQSGAQTFRLIVSCHCRHETKVCDLSLCSVTALKTDAKPQGSGPATLFEGSAGSGDGVGSGASLQRQSRRGRGGQEGILQGKDKPALLGLERQPFQKAGL